MKILSILLLLSLVSCSSRITRSIKVSKYAPEGFNPTGQVSYLNGGASFVINARREDAFKKMYEECDGKYEIVREGAENSSPSYHLTGNSMYSTSAQYVFIDFKCTQRTPASNK